jgi:hypothetical protein
MSAPLAVDGPEPPDGTALYWPETQTTFAAMFVRDDAAAQALGHPDAHWFTPNDDDELNMAEAVQFRRVEPAEGQPS